MFMRKMIMVNRKREKIAPHVQTRDSLRVICLLEPWEDRYQSEVKVSLWVTDEKEPKGEFVSADKSGQFIACVERGSELAKKLEAGELEVRVHSRAGRLVSRKPLEGTIGGTLGIKLRIAARETDSWPIVRPALLRRLAKQAASIQQVNPEHANAPRSVIQSMRELNKAGRLANRALTGRKDAMEKLRRMLSTEAIRSPGGTPRRYSRIVGAGLQALDELDTGFLPFGCDPDIDHVINVVKAGYLLDVMSGSLDAGWTRLARAFVETRRRVSADYIGSTERAYSERQDRLGRPPKEESLDFPFEPEGTELILPPDLPPPDDLEQTESPNSFDPDCLQISELCMALFEASAIASQNWENKYLRLLGSLEPHCLCYGYDPTQEFTLRPAWPEKAPFPIPKPDDLHLYFNNEDITSSISSYGAEAIRFSMPPHLYNRSGIVSLTDLSDLPNLGPMVDNSTLTRLCGLSIPNVPDFGNLGPLGRQPYLSIVHPPVFDMVWADGIKEDATWPDKPCVAPMKICWRSYLLDQSSAEPLIPCASIEVTIRDEDGRIVVDRGDASGCVRIDLSEKRIYRAEAFSLAGGKLCGAAVPVRLAVNPIHRILLISEEGNRGEIRSGKSGFFYLELSCPPEEDLQIQLQSDQPHLLSVNAGVRVPAGQSQVKVEFRAFATHVFCQHATITASARFHHNARLTYLVYYEPVLEWLYSPPVARAHWGFSVAVATDCLPSDPSRVRWRVVHIDENGQPRNLAVTVRPMIGDYNNYELTVSDEHAALLSFGVCRITVAVPDRNVVSNTLEFKVDRCLIGITLDAISVGVEQSNENMDLAVTARADGRSVRWPADRESEEIFGTVRPGLLFYTFELRKGETRAVQVSAQVIDVDTFLRFGDDEGSGAGQLNAICGESSVTLQIPIQAGSIQSSGDGHVGIDLNTGEVHGEGNVAISGGTETDGRVDVTFRGTLFGPAGPI